MLMSSSSRRQVLTTIHLLPESRGQGRLSLALEPRMLNCMNLLAFGATKGEKGSMWKFLLAVLAITGLTLAVACGDDDDDSEDQATAEQNLCSSLAGLSDSLAAFQALDPTSASYDDYDAAAADVGDAWDQVKPDAADVSAADTTALESAYDDLAQAIEDAPRDEPVSKALNSLSDEVAAVDSAWAEINDGLNCGS